jgi:hypothetical protein
VTVAVLVSNRPEWVEHGLESARRVADKVVFRFHDSGEFVDVLNDALVEASRYEPVCLKVDDHDEYPDDHKDILRYWEPGITVWGEARRFNCVGHELPARSTLCSSAFPTTLTLEADKTGMVWKSVVGQTRVIDVQTEVRKRVCVLEWGWNEPPRKICPH